MPPRNRTPLFAGEGLDRESGLMVVNPVNFDDLRNVLLHEGQMQLRPGFVPAGVGSFDEVDRIVAGYPLKSDGLGIVVGYNSSTERVYVYRVTPDITLVELLGEWVHDLSSGWGPNTPRVIMTEVFGRVFMAHDESRVTRRAPTLYYDPFGAQLLNNLTATFAGTSLESAESGAPESESVVVVPDAIRFRGVVRHLQYLVGWGFGTAAETRPELVRISLPGDPVSFDENHYFVAGDRRDPVLACGPTGVIDGPSAILNVWKSSETHAIFGFDRSTFGMRLIDPRHGIVASRAWVNVEGFAVAWAEEGPRIWQGLGPSESLEIPLALDAWEPDDLAAEGDIADAFALYVPRERVAWFIFGRRVYALTARIKGRWRWSYQTLGFDSYGAATFFETIEQALPPPGYPSCDGVTPAGTFADILVGNHNQDGDETLEVWLRPTPQAGGLAKTADGKLARYIANDPTEPFDLNDWQPSAGSTEAITSGQLRWTQGSGVRGLIHTAVPAREKGLVQAKVTQITGGASNTSVYVGVIAAFDPQNDIDGYAKAKAFGPQTGAGQRVSFLNRVINSAGAGAVTGAEGTAAFGTFRKMAVYANTQPASESNRTLQGWNEVDGQLLDGQPTIDMTLLTGQAGLWRFNSGNSSPAACSEFYYATDKFISVTGGVPDGWKVQLRNAAEAVLDEEVVSGGGGDALFDLMTNQIWMDDINAVVILNASDVEIARVEPPDGVWGGDTYTFTPAASGDWFLARSVAVTTGSQQTVRVTGLDTATQYDVALRYRRGLFYNAGAEDTANPQTWPSVSRCDFLTTIDPPTLNSLTWERTGAGSERIQLSISPLVGAEDEDIEVWRANDVGGSPGTFVLVTTISGPHAATFTYDDTTVVGEQAYHYALITAATAGDSPLSPSQRVWVGPAAIPVIVYGVFGSGNLPILGFTTTDATLPTEYYDQLIPGNPPTVGGFQLKNTMAAGETEAFASSNPGLDEDDNVEWLARLRHKKTTFGVDDFGEYSATFLFDWPEGL